MEPNPQFTITKKLRPCRVTKNLLLDLERSIAATLSDIAGESGKTRKATKLSITDADGEEVLTSAEQISGDQLPNSTKQIQLEMSVTSSGDEKAAIILTVRLHFGDSIPPMLRIILQCPRARDQAIGVEGRIKRLMENSFDQSRFFYPSAGVVGTVGFACFIGSFFWLVFSAVSLWKRDPANLTSDAFVFWTAALAALWAYTVVCTRYFPNCAFDTKRRAELDEQKTWARKAVWSLVGVNILVLTVGGTVLEKMRAYLGF